MRCSPLEAVRQRESLSVKEKSIYDGEGCRDVQLHDAELMQRAMRQLVGPVRELDSLELVE